MHVAAVVLFPVSLLLSFLYLKKKIITARVPTLQNDGETFKLERVCIDLEGND